MNIKIGKFKDTDFSVHEVPVTHRILKNAKCSVDIYKNPIGANSILKFHSFNHPKNHITDKIREIKAISELSQFTKYGEEWVYYNYENDGPCLKFKFSGKTINPEHFIENSAIPLLYVRDENVVIRFFSNFLINFELENIRNI